MHCDGVLGFQYRAKDMGYVYYHRVYLLIVMQGVHNQGCPV